VRGALQRLWRRPPAVAPAPAGDWLGWWRERGERELRCILMTAWDPLGVASVPSAWDEYDDYLPAVVGPLRTSAEREREQAAEELADVLEGIERERMSLPPRPRVDYQTVADHLLAWHTWSFDHDGRPPTQWADD
jgi:hypothetical protein